MHVHLEERVDLTRIRVTSWNFLILSDFAPHKPVNIPNDDPTSFQYFLMGVEDVVVM